MRCLDFYNNNSELFQELAGVSAGAVWLDRTQYFGKRTIKQTLTAFVTTTGKVVVLVHHEVQ